MYFDKLWYLVNQSVMKFACTESHL